MRKTIPFFMAILCLLDIHSVHAQATLVPEIDVIEKAKVLGATNATTTLESGVKTQTQLLKIEVLNGRDEGAVITFTNDYTQLKQGEVFYVRHQKDAFESNDNWTVSDPYRLDTLLYLLAVFLILLFAFGGIQGVRGLLSLVGSLLLIFYVLLPGILHGYSATFVSIGVAALIIIVGSYITHGFNKTTSSAVLGMIATVLFVGAAAYYAVHAGRLSGFTSEENVYLNMNAQGSINMVGLLFGGIIIGLLGVLYDIAIGQAIAVEELYRAGRHMSRKEIYTRAIRIGREHIGALVNTLAIAYVGVALPLILLAVQSSSSGLLPILNSEIFATEAIRILVGSIGLIIAVPVTTFIATYLLSHMEGKGGTGNHGHHH
jgi:uncharacterized membrane protein